MESRVQHMPTKALNTDMYPNLLLFPLQVAIWKCVRKWRRKMQAEIKRNKQSEYYLVLKYSITTPQGKNVKNILRS